jgi:hypothetical protein
VTPYPEIGDREQTGKFKERDYRLKLTIRVIDSVMMEKVLGGTTPASSTPSETATFKMAITNGSKYIYFNLTNLLGDNWTGTVPVNETVLEDVEFTARGMSADEVDQ